MMRKVLFTDLDETLLNRDKSISKENREAIVKMVEQGHDFVLVTGRPVATARTVVKELGLAMPRCYMVAFNGAVVYDCVADRVLAERTLPIEIAKEVITEARKAGIYVQTYQQDMILTEKHSKELDAYLSNAKMRYRLTENLYTGLEEEPYKLILIELENQERLRQFQEQHPELMERGNCFFSRSEYLEYCPKDTDKGSGLRYISKFLNIPMENTVAVGDERNDIPMIQAANIGVAVKNGHEDLKKAADYITEHDNEHGAVAEVIEKFILG
ncbi:MAG: HAD family phosphatase [Lachnospiraceae bacterium]|nr:HAD family phosphatase [Lachnospiraceae bacterium]